MSMPCLLLLDCGNTRCKWAVRSLSHTHWPGPEATVASGVLRVAPANQLVAALRQQLAEQLPQAAELIGIAVCSVWRSSATQALQQALHQQWPATPYAQLSAYAQWHDLRSAYAQPEKLGADRWAGLIAAHQHYPQQNLLIVNAGTATTLDALCAKGQHLGGQILPGLDLMLKSLGQHTANLPSLDSTYATDSLNWGQTTKAAMLTGCLSAQIGALQLALARMLANGYAPAGLVIAGGSAPILLADLQSGLVSHPPLYLMPTLVLDGLAIWYADIQQATSN